jgi:hypothetical protein
VVILRVLLCCIRGDAQGWNKLARIGSAVFGARAGASPPASNIAMSLAPTRPTNSGAPHKSTAAGVSARVSNDAPPLAPNRAMRLAPTKPTGSARAPDTNIAAGMSVRTHKDIAAVTAVGTEQTIARDVKVDVANCSNLREASENAIVESVAQLAKMLAARTPNRAMSLAPTKPTNSTRAPDPSTAAGVSVRRHKDIYAATTVATGQSIDHDWATRMIFK